VKLPSFFGANYYKEQLSQKLHQDIDPFITKNHLDCLGTKPCIGFTPISEDGMMIAVWTEEEKQEANTVTWNRFQKIT